MIKNSIIILLLTISFLSSCKKDAENENSSGPAQVYLQLAKVEFDTENLEENTSTKTASTSLSRTPNLSNQTQRMLVPFDDNIQILAELSVDTEKSNSASLSNIKKQMSVNGKSIDKTAAIVQSPLQDKILYKLLVYKNGAFLDERTIIHGQEPQTQPFALNAGEAYSFVAYSVNSTTELPAILTKELLSTARVADVSGDLLWYKADFTPVAGVNNLPIILKHMFSQVTVILSTGAYGGQVKGVDKASFEQLNLSGSINLSNGNLTYNATKVQKVVEFTAGSMDNAIVTSLPALLISPATTTGKFNITNLNINGLSKPIVLENLKISPGKKYNLNLTVNAPCTQEVFLENFNLTNGETKTFSAPRSDYGFIFDVFYLDNSLNLNINGKPLLQREFWEERYENTGVIIPNWQWVQKIHRTEAYDFQFVDLHTDVPPLVQNLQFKSDKKRWGIKNANGVADISEIYFVKGDKDHPIFRIHILPTGDIKLYASRTDYGQLEEVEVLTDKRGPIYNNDNETTIRYYYKAALNTTVQWNTTGTNTIIASQINSGPTNMIGRGYGRMRVNCTP